MDTFDGDIRTTKVLSDDELRVSLKGGWSEHLPAIKDENGVLLVGHRRMKIAQDEGIKPVVKVVTFGNDDAARVRLANVSNIGGAPLTPEDRRRQVERLYKGGATQQVIAHMLGVSQKTISLDLDSYPGINSPRPKTASNPKGAGRLKVVKLKRKPGEIQRQASINVKPEDWEQFKQKAEAKGVSAAAALGEVIATPEIKRDTLALSAQERLDAAMRQHKRKLDLDFERTVQEEIRKRIDGMVLPEWKRQIAEAKTLYDRRRGLMSKETFNTIRRALHPDSRNSVSEDRLGAAFRAFMELEKFLLDEKDSPTNFGGLPSNLAEWDRMKAKHRAAKAAAKQTMRPR